jgi:GTPase SAR1 family protein
MPISLQSVAKKWIDEVLLHCEGVPRILVGCKSDLRKGPRSADEEPLVTIEEVIRI